MPGAPFVESFAPSSEQRSHRILYPMKTTQRGMELLAKQTILAEGRKGKALPLILFPFPFFKPLLQGNSPFLEEALALMIWFLDF